MSGRLGSLNGNFTNHFAGTAAIFNQVMATQTRVDEIEAGAQHRIDMQEATRFGEEAQQRGATDAITGAEPPEDLRSNGHYMRAREGAAGQIAGRALADRWNNEVLRIAPAGSDINALSQEWMRSNLRPTGSAAHDFQAARILAHGVDAGTSRWRSEGVRQVQQEGVVTASNSLALSVQRGDYQPEDVQRWIAERRILAPNDAENAAARVAQLIADNVVPTPDGVARFNQTMSHPASGGDGTSFFDRHAATRTGLEARINSRMDSTSTASANIAWQGITTDIAAATTVESMAALETRARQTLNTQGGFNQYQTTMAALATHRRAAVRATVGINQVDAMIGQGAQVDPSVVRENLSGYFAAHQLDPRRAPEATGQIVGRLGVIDDATKQTMGTALGSFGERAGQVSSYRFWQTVSAGRGGVEAALDMMPENTRPLFQALRAMDAGGNAAIEANLERLDKAGGLDIARLRRETPLHVAVGQTSESAGRTVVDTAITTRIAATLNTAGYISNNLRIDPALTGAMREAIHIQTLVNTRLGIGGGLEKAAELALQSVSSRVDAIPGVDGNYTAMLRGPVPAVYTDGQRSAPASRAAFNPATGRPEDTVGRFETDRTAALAVAPDVFRGNAVGLGPPARDMPAGLYPMVDGTGVAVMIHAGQNLRVNGANVAVPQDLAAASAALSTAMGGNPRFQLVERAPGIFAMGYRFGFSQSTLADRERSYRPPQTVPVIPNGGVESLAPPEELGPATPPPRPRTRPVPPTR